MAKLYDQDWNLIAESVDHTRLWAVTEEDGRRHYLRADSWCGDVPEKYAEWKAPDPYRPYVFPGADPMFAWPKFRKQIGAGDCNDPNRR